MLKQVQHDERLRAFGQPLNQFSEDALREKSERRLARS